MKKIILICACALCNYDIFGMQNKFPETRYEINTKKLTNFLKEEYTSYAVNIAVSDIICQLIQDRNVRNKVISILKQSEIDTDTLSLIFTQCKRPRTPLVAYKYNKLFAIMIHDNKNQCEALAQLLENSTQNAEALITYFTPYYKGINQHTKSITENIQRISTIQISATDDSKITILSNMLALYGNLQAPLPGLSALSDTIARDIFDHMTLLCITSKKMDDPEHTQQ